jgi:hypothetical protein
MDLNDKGTWPRDVIACLKHHGEFFRSWEARISDNAPETTEKATAIAAAYDMAVYQVRSVLDKYTLRGYHCTRLIRRESEHILSAGMHLPTQDTLFQRIDALIDDGVLSHDTATKLKCTNYADEANRAGMIWFCFYPPRFAGQLGIEPFFRSWGGEALYACHQRNSVTGPILAKIGVPTLIEAEVPISGLACDGSIVKSFYRQFLIDRGIDMRGPVHHENRTQHDEYRQSTFSVRFAFPPATFLS